MPFTPALSAAEMLYEAKVLYESIASADAPGYTNLQWSILLTRAQHNVVSRLSSEGFDKDEKHRAGLSTLLQPFSTLSPVARTDISPNAFQFNVDASKVILATYTERCRYTLSAVSRYADVIPVEWDYYKMNIDNPFEQPDSTYFWGLVGAKSTTDFSYSKMVVTPGTVGGVAVVPVELLTMAFTYPQPIIVNASVTLQGITGVTSCTLHASIHRDVVEEAANLASAYSKDREGYQIMQNEINTD
jgi:hypothetical protein